MPAFDPKVTFNSPNFTGRSRGVPADTSAADAITNLANLAGQALDTKTDIKKIEIEEDVKQKRHDLFASVGLGQLYDPDTPSDVLRADKDAALMRQQFDQNAISPLQFEIKSAILAQSLREKHGARWADTIIEKHFGRPANRVVQELQREISSSASQQAKADAASDRFIKQNAEVVADDPEFQHLYLEVGDKQAAERRVWDMLGPIASHEKEIKRQVDEAGTFERAQKVYQQQIAPDRMTAIVADHIQSTGKGMSRSALLSIKEKLREGGLTAPEVEGLVFLTQQYVNSARNKLLAYGMNTMIQTPNGRMSAAAFYGDTWLEQVSRTLDPIEEVAKQVAGEDYATALNIQELNEQKARWIEDATKADFLKKWPELAQWNTLAKEHPEFFTAVMRYLGNEDQNAVLELVTAPLKSTLAGGNLPLSDNHTFEEVLDIPNQLHKDDPEKAAKLSGAIVTTTAAALKGESPKAPDGTPITETPSAETAFKWIFEGEKTASELWKTWTPETRINAMQELMGPGVAKNVWKEIGSKNPERWERYEAFVIDSFKSLPEFRNLEADIAARVRQNADQIKVTFDKETWEWGAEWQNPEDEMAEINLGTIMDNLRDDLTSMNAYFSILKGTAEASGGQTDPKVYLEQTVLPSIVANTTPAEAEGLTLVDILDGLLDAVEFVDPGGFQAVGEAAAGAAVETGKQVGKDIKSVADTVGGVAKGVADAVTPDATPFTDTLREGTEALPFVDEGISGEAQQQLTDFLGLLDKGTPPDQAFKELKGARPEDSKLIQKESSNDPKVINTLGYAGLYQMGAPLLDRLGIYNAVPEDRLETWSKRKGKKAKWKGTFSIPGFPEVKTIDDYLKNTDAQHKAREIQLADIDKFIQKNGLTKFIGKTIKGVRVTLEGMRNVAHLGGRGGLKSLLETDGVDNRKDAYGATLLHYLALGQ
jgi:hypothetical protein